MGNFRETFGNFLETVRVVIGQETVRVGMWSPGYASYHEIFKHPSGIHLGKKDKHFSLGAALLKFRYFILEINITPWYLQPPFWQFKIRLRYRKE